MKVQVLQHVHFEGPGSIETWFSKQRADVRFTYFFDISPLLPVPETVDLVIVMGGPMSVKDEQKYPWLKQEKQFIREVIHHGTPIVGVCLGSQLIASAMGARVYNNTDKEIGWFPVEAVDADKDVFRFPQQMTVFHWHGETFDLPPGAVRLADSEACRNQAFQVGRNAIGLQFHLETTPETQDLLIENCRDELVDGTYIQTEQEIRSIQESAFADINALMEDILDFVTKSSN